MRSLISSLVRQAALAAGLCAVVTGVSAQAPTAATGVAQAPPAGFVAPAEPKADESNALRGKSQPGNNAPFWRAVRDSGDQAGVSNLPGAEMGVLIQSFVQVPGSRATTAGEAWRQVRNRWILPYGGALLFITALGLAIFYWRKGPIGQDHPATGMVERFTPFERAAHWTNATAFVVLAVSGLVLAFGKFILLPVIGATLFGWLAYLLKFAHNFVGPLFAVSLVIVMITFLKDNIANAADFAWLKSAGGMLGDKQVPSHRFNAAEKGVYWWGMFVPGLVAVGSGLVLDGLIPGLGGVRSEMQIASLIHSVVSIWVMVVLFGHIYMGTIGTRGAYSGMRTGYVSEGWAREHHVLWHDDIRAGKIPAKRSAEPVPTIGPATPQA